MTWLLRSSVSAGSLRRRRAATFAACGCAVFALAIVVGPYLSPIRAADVAQKGQAIEFTDRNGLALGTLLTIDQEHTASVPLDRVSPNFLHAMLAAEDARFYRHGPVELRSVARALWQLARQRRVVSGASTIEMQLARMLRPVPVSLIGKLREMWWAARIEAGMSKDEILDAYVNRLPMGGNLYGVEAAARTYFSEPASDLDLAQASLLAAIPNDPTRLDPYDGWHSLKARQSYVLARMAVVGYISRSQADVARREQLLLLPRGQGIVAAPHFLFWLASHVPANAAKVRTTIDRPLQEFVETQVRQVVGKLAQRNVHQAAALVIDNRTAEVLAYVGSADYFSSAFQGRNDGVQALRQPGSSLKPFLYELALETNAIRPNTILADVPTHYTIPGALLYSPEDYSGSYQGPVRVRIALADSLNVPAVRVLSRVGVAPFLDRLRALGFTHLTKSADYYGLGLTLGAGEVSLWELARAYVTIARAGRATHLRTTLDMAAPADAAPRIGFTDPSTAKTIGDPTDWAMVTDILADAHARARSFGIGSLLDMPFSAAVKTGTSSDFRDTWTTGFSSEYTVAVWVGNFDGAPMQHISGVTGAAPLWNRIMMHLHQGADPQPFAPPAAFVQRPICATTGLRPTPECASIVEEYLAPQDLAGYDAVGARAPSMPRAYDEWRALQDPVAARIADFRILYPDAGDLFELEPVDPRAAIPPLPQVLEFQAAALRGEPVAWRLNGRMLAARSDGKYFWRLAPGRWTLEAQCRNRVDRVTFVVERAGRPAVRKGFSLH